MHIYSFEKLDVWIETRKWVSWIYKLTSNFPSDEKYTLTSQTRRAAISVLSNIAEGSARKSSKDQAHFYQMAYSSLIEVLSHLIIASDLNYFKEDKLIEGRKWIEVLTSKVAALKNIQLSKLQNPKP